MSGERVKRIQSAVVSNNAFLLVAGLTALLVVFGVMGGWFV
jgi:NADH-quinone oxidoreductase subunit L